MMKLTEAERETIIAQLREEALTQVREWGCTCEPEPVMTLTEHGIGRYDLPAWMSDHSDDCALARALES